MNSRALRNFAFSLCAFVLQTAFASSSLAAAVADPVPITLGQAVFALDGPWKFRVGDNPDWAKPSFDDSAWETIDLTPPAGARDFDVGLTGYVPGWQARAHRGYFGYAWYRIRVSVIAPKGEPLALCGPFYVDSTYQVFINGQLLGGVGDFSGQTPVAYNMHPPKIFPLPRSSEFEFSEHDGYALVAIRVWMGPWALGDPEAGGIHIAPALGTTSGVQSLYRIQWSETIRGYIVDAVEALLFLFLAVMTCSLIPIDRANPAYLWLTAALVLIALARANQAVFFWWQFETVQEFELVTAVLLVPLSLAAWTLAWRNWFCLRNWGWMPAVITVLTLLYIGSQFLGRSWFYGVFPHWVGVATHFCALAVRLSFVLLTLLIIIRGISRLGNERWFVLPAILLVSAGLFAQELSLLHIPGIWFPFGTGVSRTQYAYAAFDVALFALLLHRLYALRQQPTTR